MYSSRFVEERVHLCTILLEKGTRISPLPAAEVNSKPSVKLPKLIKIDGQTRPITILEAVLAETSIYAPSRADRLSVFWGDQVIINEDDIDFRGEHQIEIFGQIVPLSKDIESYGVLICDHEGDCKQREKMALDVVKKMLPEGSDSVCRSMGFFTISLAFLEALLDMPEHKVCLEKCEGKLNTDPDWWQPLTSTVEEYLLGMEKKGVLPEIARLKWESIHSMWEIFKKSDGCKNAGLKRLLGFNNVGEGSSWWDYGQNKFYLENMKLLTRRVPEGEIARKFFGVDEDDWIGNESSCPDVRIEDSVVLGSTIKKGRLKNCVVIDSVIDEIDAEDAIIVSSRVIKVHAKNSLCYNVVLPSVTLKRDQIIVNVFHPDKGRIVMRTNTDRDGSVDWDKKIRIDDNAYTYPELSGLMNGLSVEECESIKEDFLRQLESSGPESLEN